MNPGTVTWDTARAAGFVAYALLSASVALGIALSLFWRSPRWPRFVTNETHRFLTLLALIFTGIHTLAVAIDPFIRFSLPEVVVPFISHYRPLWIALGIVGAYLLAAVYASEWVRPLVGYAWWRRFHALAFVVYLFATIHGLGTGSDSRALWAIALYGGSVTVVGALIAVRLLPRPPAVRRPLLAAAGTVVLLAGGLWAWSGPLQPGWNRTANNGQGSGGVVTAGVAPVTDGSTPSPEPQAAFRVGFTGSVAETGTGGDQTVTLDGTLDGSPSGTFELVLSAGGEGEGIVGQLSLQTSDGLACAGPLVQADEGGLAALCRDASGASWAVSVTARSQPDGSVRGTLAVEPASPSGSATDPQSPG